MNNYFKIIFYYLIIFSTFLLVLWIIWARFFRERLVKDIPIMLTEYGFWILVYLCLVYIIVVSVILFSIFNHKINKEAKKAIIKELLNQIYIPFIMLDHLIKHNNYFQKSYSNLMILIINNIKDFKKTSFILLILIFQIIPRLILVVFLIMDTFYFHKLETLYKIILLGVFPFIFRYIKYNFSDFKDYNIKLLDVEYNMVLLLKEVPTDYNEDKDYPHYLDNEDNLDNKTLSIKEYFEFKIKQNIYGIPNIIYTETCFAKQETYDKYNETHKIFSKTKLNSEIYEDIHEKFKIYTNIICDSATIYEKISYFQNKKIILYLRVFIYTSYLICWGYILVTSYYTHPIELPMFKVLVENLIGYSYLYDLDPFSMINQFSRNENLITPENVWNLIKSIFNKIMFIIKNKLP